VTILNAESLVAFVKHASVVAWALWCCGAVVNISAAGVMVLWFVVRWKATEDEQLRALMGEQKALAVDLYGKLQVRSGL
jgi:hypothetical protein